jgi:hypothetical protein
LSKSIDELILKIERHKGSFNPSKQAYLDYIFEFTYKLLEYDGIENPGQSSDLVPVMRQFIKQDARYAKKAYKHGGCVLTPPPVSEAQKRAWEYYTKATYN